MTFPLLHHVNAPSVPVLHSGTAPYHMEQLNPLPNPNPDLSVGPETYLVSYADEMNRKSSFERSRFLAQWESRCFFSISSFFPTKSL
ncbi:hypothetical protein CY34DRAFT_365704 [Suillus luteus UH-Slu-Lm8-n1]|uniref:Uncharacterized protein n=1 Tax=Suillus luteus UH-Slu-Lm8-n1 TaxID=930992 RepID=A0A0C9ZMQ3_9AGAM|nr:hypothetical protein CY34DRAFT_365704 [Suillus luteus UH-Slu-Lm8-n1]